MKNVPQRKIQTDSLVSGEPCFKGKTTNLTHGSLSQRREEEKEPSHSPFEAGMTRIEMLKTSQEKKGTKPHPNKHRWRKVPTKIATTGRIHREKGPCPTPEQHWPQERKAGWTPQNQGV